MWLKPWLGRRTNLGLYEMLVQELRFEDEPGYKKLLRMTPQDFDKILGFIQDDITKTNTNMHDSIPTNIKLAATVRFLVVCFGYIFGNKFLNIIQQLANNPVDPTRAKSSDS